MKRSTKRHQAVFHSQRSKCLQITHNMVFLVGFGYILQHFTLRFVAFCLAFWCILRCILLQNALQQLAINLHFLVVVDANLGVLFFKEKCKSIANGQKRRG